MPLLAQCLFAFYNQHTAMARAPYPHAHACTELVFVGNVHGWMCEDDRRWRYGPNQIAVYQPGPRHWALSDADSVGYHLCIGVTGGESGLIPADVYDANQDLILLFKLIENLLALPVESATQASRLNLLASLICQSLREQYAAGAQATTHGYAQTAKLMIDTEFMAPLTVDDLATRIYISGDHLRYLFRKEYGVGPIHYLLRKRIEYAERLLTTTDKKVQEIARLCGFDDPAYFSRLFKHHNGSSPLQYRNSGRRDE
jgi:AraC-like DNA-binding protein